jgi:hypothetical protein
MTDEDHMPPKKKTIDKWYPLLHWDHHCADFTKKVKTFSKRKDQTGFVVLIRFRRRREQATDVPEAPVSSE